MPAPRGSLAVRATGYIDVIAVAVACFFAGSVQAGTLWVQGQFGTWFLVVRPDHCPHCGAQHTSIFWGSYARWVRLTTHRVRIQIERVRCTVCRVTDALLPSFLHMFRHYALPLIQQAITLAIDAGLWKDGEALRNFFTSNTSLGEGAVKMSGA